MGQLSGGAKCLKYTLFIFNLILFLLGLALFIISIVVLVRTSGSTSAFNLQRFVIGYVVASLVVIIITFFGCCGAIRESRCMLIFFIVCLVIVLLFCLAIEIALGVGLSWVQTNTDNELLQMRINYTNNNDIRNMWDQLQRDSKCCGVYNYTDWAQFYNNSVPDSCCINYTSSSYTLGCGTGLATRTVDDVAKVIYIEGCGDEVRASLRYLVQGVLAVVGILLFLEVLGIIFSCCLQQKIANEGNYNTV